MEQDAIVQDGPDTLAELRAELDTARTAAAASSGDAAVLAHLAETLHWDGGPRALQAVLPLARLLRRARGRTSSSSPTPAASAGPRRALPTRIAMRLFDMTRPVSLPLARHAYRLLGRLLEREDKLSHREVASASAAAPATADLMRSIEAAMLTLALQRRG